MIIGEARFKIRDSWAKGLQTHEALQPVVNEAMVNAMVTSIIKGLLEEIL